MKRLFCLSILFFISIQLSAQETRPPETRPSETQPQTQPFVSLLLDLGEMPEFQGISEWINSPPLTKAKLKGKVVLVDFWTYSCINCIRTFPHLLDWYQRYKKQGFVIIGVHSPEFDFEKDTNNVKAAINKYKITYPVALDNEMKTWTAFNNRFWPAHYFIDAKGRIRYTHFGEGKYEESEKVIQDLLAEQAATIAETQPAKAKKPGARPAEEDLSQIESPETYLGFSRRDRLITSGRPLQLNEWNLEGKWGVQSERITLKEGSGKIRFRFKARKVNLVMHPGAAPGKALIRLDGQPVSPQKAGRDVKDSFVNIAEPRLYEIVNSGPKAEEHTVEIEILTPGVAAYAFTFG